LTLPPSKIALLPVRPYNKEVITLFPEPDSPIIACMQPS